MQMQVKVWKVVPLRPRQRRRSCQNRLLAAEGGFSQTDPPQGWPKTTLKLAAPHGLPISSGVNDRVLCVLQLAATGMGDIDGKLFEVKVVDGVTLVTDRLPKAAANVPEYMQEVTTDENIFRGHVRCVEECRRRGVDGWLT